MVRISSSMKSVSVRCCQSSNFVKSHAHNETSISLPSCSTACFLQAGDILQYYQPNECGHIEMTSSSSSELEGTSVTFKAIPRSEYLFTGWSGSLSGTENPKTVTVTADINVVANFELKTYPLSISVEGEGMVNERVVTTKTDYMAPGRWLNSRRHHPQAGRLTNGKKIFPGPITRPGFPFPEPSRSRLSSPKTSMLITLVLWGRICG